MFAWCIKSCCCFCRFCRGYDKMTWLVHKFKSTNSEEKRSAIIRFMRKKGLRFDESKCDEIVDSFFTATKELAMSDAQKDLISDIKLWSKDVRQKAVDKMCLTIRGAQRHLPESTFVCFYDMCQSQQLDELFVQYIVDECWWFWDSNRLPFSSLLSLLHMAIEKAPEQAVKSLCGVSWQNPNVLHWVSKAILSYMSHVPQEDATLMLLAQKMESSFKPGYASQDIPVLSQNALTFSIDQLTTTLRFILDNNIVSIRVWKIVSCMVLFLDKRVSSTSGDQGSLKMVFDRMLAQIQDPVIDFGESFPCVIDALCTCFRGEFYRGRCQVPTQLFDKMRTSNFSVLYFTRRPFIHGEIDFCFEKLKAAEASVDLSNRPQHQITDIS